MRDVPAQRVSPGDPTGKPREGLPNRPLQQFFSFEPDNEAVGGDGLFVSKDTEIFGGGDVPGEANGFGNRFRASSVGGHDDHWGSGGAGGIAEAVRGWRSEKSPCDQAVPA